MELVLHVAVREAASSEFEQEMKRRFGMICHDSVTTYPVGTDPLDDLEDQAEMDSLYVVATKRLPPQSIQARARELYQFLVEEQQKGNVTNTYFEPDDEEALRLLALGLLSQARGQYHVPVLLLLTTEMNPLQGNEIEEHFVSGSHATASPPLPTGQPPSVPQVSVYINNTASQVDVFHAFLRPQQVPLPLGDLCWSRMLYSHYITLSLRLDWLAVNAGFHSEEAALLLELLPAWETWFSERVGDDSVVARQQQRLAHLVSAVSEPGSSKIQDLLAQFTETQHISFDQGTVFTCRLCFLKTSSVRVAYYHGLLTSSLDEAAI